MTMVLDKTWTTIASSIAAEDGKYNESAGASERYRAWTHKDWLSLLATTLNCQV
jgi:hypothetical protein